MDNRLKQRLIGAFVIVILAVIFIPYLLEEPAEPEQPVADLESPPRPEQNFTDRPPATEPTLTEDISEATEPAPVPEPELPEIELMGLQPRPPVTTVDITENQEPAPDQAERAERARFEAERAERARLEAEQAERARLEAERVERARLEAERAEKARAEQARAEAERAERARAERARAEAERAERARLEAERARTEAKPDIVLPKIELIGRPSNSNTATPPPAPLQTAAAERFGWLVQAGSFTQRNNAYELRDRLRNRGFNTFVEEAREAGRTWYRVRIGPQLSRAESENILARLQRETGINGLVLSPE